MKTITCKVVSTTPISLSKAASILSEFASSENGASHAVAAYLRRSSAAFTELVQLHKELKSKRKHNKIRKSEIIEDTDHQQQPSEKRGGLSEEKVSDEVKHKKKQKKDAGRVKIEEVKVSQRSDLCRDPSYETKKNDKRKETRELNNVGQIGSSFEGKVKEEAVHDNKGKNKIEIGNFEKDEKKKKRKSREVKEEEGKGKNTSEEQRRKKKKKKKIKSEGDS